MDQKLAFSKTYDFGYTNLQETHVLCFCIFLIPYVNLLLSMDTGQVTKKKNSDRNISYF